MRDVAAADRAAILREAMTQTDTTQGVLARISGVRQPSISGFLSGRVPMSDEMLDRLLACMGYELVVTRSAAQPPMTRDSRRRWLLHRELASTLDEGSWPVWQKTMRAGIRRLRASTRGQPHQRNLDRWQHLADTGDLAALRRVLVDPSEEGIAMREVSPLGGLLPNDARLRVLAEARQRKSPARRLEVPAPLPAT